MKYDYADLALAQIVLKRDALIAAENDRLRCGSIHLTAQVRSLANLCVASTLRSERATKPLAATHSESGSCSAVRCYHPAIFRVTAEDLSGQAAAVAAETVDRLL